MSPEEIRAEFDAYEGAIAYLDCQLGLLFRELERRGILEDSLVIVTSDHGEEFGEHGVFDHGQSLYLPSLLVPLLISFPSCMPVGKRIEVPVSLRDIPATVLELVGLGAYNSPPGRSLARYWGGSAETSIPLGDVLLSETEHDPTGQAWYPAMKGDIKSLVFEGMHYIKNVGDGREELYDVVGDPWETRDLASAEEGLRLLDRFRMLLDSTCRDCILS